LAGIVAGPVGRIGPFRATGTVGVRSTAPLPGRPLATTERVLELSGLTRRFGDITALDGVSFSVAPGQMFGFVGPNGAGKTTTMRIVLGVLEPDAGTVRWRGREIDAATRARFGYMPEERGLYPKMRVRDQLAYFARLHGLGGPAATAAANRLIERLGLEARAGDRVETLSLGNQQRVQLGVALVHDPEVLVLDEPFSGLDPVGVDVLSGVLQERARAGVPVVFSSHQLELVERLCEAVAIVNHGRVVATGAVEQLRERGRDGRHVRVHVAGDGDGRWLHAVPGAELVEAGPRGVLVRLRDDADPDRVLDAARSAGTVTHFSLERPTLSDLFRAAVTA
jgi:ABC-2 type transport system ATP-binding protein